jgi:hypothetical protein
LCRIFSSEGAIDDTVPSVHLWNILLQPKNTACHIISYHTITHHTLCHTIPCKKNKTWLVFHWERKVALLHRTKNVTPYRLGARTTTTIYQQVWCLYHFLTNGMSKFCSKPTPLPKYPPKMITSSYESKE